MPNPISTPNFSECSPLTPNDQRVGNTAPPNTGLMDGAASNSDTIEVLENVSFVLTSIAMQETRTDSPIRILSRNEANDRYSPGPSENLFPKNPNSN